MPFFYYCIHRNDFYILYSSQSLAWFQLSLGYHTRGLKKGILIQDVGSIRSAPLFLVTSPLGRIKRTPLTPQSQTCMFVIFASRLSLPLVVLRDIENLFIIDRPVFPVKFAQTLLQERRATETSKDAATGGATRRFSGFSDRCDFCAITAPATLSSSQETRRDARVRLLRSM